MPFSCTGMSGTYLTSMLLLTMMSAAIVKASIGRSLFVRNSEPGLVKSRPWPKARLRTDASLTSSLPLVQVGGNSSSLWPGSTSPLEKKEPSIRRLSSPSTFDPPRKYHRYRSCCFAAARKTRDRKYNSRREKEDFPPRVKQRSLYTECPISFVFI